VRRSGAMPYSTPAEKQAARQQRAIAQRIGGAVAVGVRGLAVIAAAGAASAGGALAVAVSMPVAVLIASLLLVEKMFELWAQDAAHVINDPPRTDFRTQTRARPRPFYPWVFGSSPVEQSATAAAGKLNQAAAHVRALVTARERAWGARNRNELQWERVQLAAAAEFSHMTASDLRAVIEPFQTLASTVDDSAFRDVLRENEEVRRAAERLPVGDLPMEAFLKRGVEEYLPAESLALLYRAGIRIEHLRRPLPRSPTPPDPLGDVAASLREASEPLTAFASSLESVRPDEPFEPTGSGE
jgi:hypothetical protein